QPWSRIGIWCVGSGMLLFVSAVLIGQIAPILVLFSTVLGAALVLLAAGWLSLLAAFVKRHQWSRAHPLIMPALSEARDGAVETR
ncbi:MAG TPA: hypothetical protein VGL73_14860, partial [Caulobacteraceae bacterium]